MSLRVTSARCVDAWAEKDLLDPFACLLGIDYVYILEFDRRTRNKLRDRNGGFLIPMLSYYSSAG